MLERIVARLRAVEPSLLAVVLCGSHARGSASAYSDVDVLAVTSESPQRRERAWFEPTPNGASVHISVELMSAADFAAEGDSSEPVSWGLGFAVVDTMRLVWATDEGRQLVGDDPTECHSAGASELEDFAECYMKIRRAAAEGDAVLLRWSSRMLAEFSVGLLRELNPAVQVSSTVEALKAALSFRECPETYAHDVRVCWGLLPATDDDVVRSATRLQQSVLERLKEHLATGVWDTDDVRALLVDGRLQRYLSE